MSAGNVAPAATARTVLAVGPTASGITTALLRQVAEWARATEGARALVVVRTRLARASAALQLARDAPDISASVLCCCAAALERALEPGCATLEDPGDSDTLWRYLHSSAKADLVATARQSGCGEALLVPSLGRARRAAREAVVEPGRRFERLVAGLSSLSGVGIDDLECHDEVVLDLLDLVARKTKVVAGAHRLELGERRGGQSVLERVPHLAAHISHLDTSYRTSELCELEEAVCSSSPTRITARSSSDETGVGDGGICFTGGRVPTLRDAARLLVFSSEGAARRLVTEALARTHARPDDDGMLTGDRDADELEECAALSHLLARERETVLVATFGWVDASGLLRAADQAGLALDDASSPTRLGGPRYECYLRFLNGGVPPQPRRRAAGSRDAPEMPLDALLAFLRAYLVALPRRARVEEPEVVLADAACRLDTELGSPALLSSGRLGVHELESAADLLDGCGSGGLELRGLFATWARFEADHALCKTRVRYLARRIERQLPDRRPGGQRIQASPAAQLLLTDPSCPVDARRAAWHLFSAAHRRSEVPLLLRRDAVLMAAVELTRGVRGDVAILFGVHDGWAPVNGVLDGYLGDDRARAEQARLALGIGRGQSRVVCISWGEHRSGLIDPRWFSRGAELWPPAH